MKIIKIDYSNLNCEKLKKMNDSATSIYNAENEKMGWRQKLGTSYTQNAHESIKNGIFAEELFHFMYPKYERSEAMSFLPYDFCNKNAWTYIDLKTLNTKNDIDCILDTQSYFLQAHSVHKLEKFANLHNIQLHKCMYFIWILNIEKKVLNVVISTNFLLSKILKLKSEYIMPSWSRTTANIKPIENYVLEYDDDGSREIYEFELS